MADPAVDIRGVTYRYGEVVALRDVSFSVASGTLFGLLGPNGGGKTTLFRILSTLLVPEVGTVHVAGYLLTKRARQIKLLLGTVFQQPALDAELTVLENLRIQGALYGLHGAPLRERIDGLLESFGLGDRRAQRIKTLSGGLQRRVDLARGLLHRPSVLLLDEPTVGLDPAARHTFWQTLARLRKEEDTTMLVATHLMDEAELCDRVGIIDQGRLVALGVPSSLKDTLGGETLWLHSNDAPTLLQGIQRSLGFDANLVGDTVQISHPEAHTLIAALYEAFAPLILSATVRQPTLEDVFLIHAGHRLDEQPLGQDT